MGGITSLAIILHAGLCLRTTQTFIASIRLGCIDQLIPSQTIKFRPNFSLHSPHILRGVHAIDLLQQMVTRTLKLEFVLRGKQIFHFNNIWTGVFHYLFEFSIYLLLSALIRLVRLHAVNISKPEASRNIDCGMTSFEEI